MERYRLAVGSVAVSAVCVAVLWAHKAAFDIAARWVADNNAILLVGLAIIVFLQGIMGAMGAVKQVVGSVKQDVERLEKAVSARAPSVAFSKVSQTVAAKMLQATRLTLMFGDDDELRVGSSRARRTAAVPSFVWPPHSSEADGTPAALEHLRTHLQRLGVKFGRGGYALLDMHMRNTSLEFMVDKVLYKGGVDGAIVPFGVTPLSAPNHARVVFELKLREEAKYKDLGDRALGQSIAELFGVNAQVTYPCIVVLTDGTVCDVLRLRGARVERWAGVTLAETLAYVAEYLSSESSPVIEEQPGKLLHTDPQTAQTLQRLQELVPVRGGALAAAAEQLESLLALEDDVDAGREARSARRMALATELAAQWRHAIEPQELPQHLSHLFA